MTLGSQGMPMAQGMIKKMSRTLVGGGFSRLWGLGRWICYFAPVLCALITR